MKNLVAPNPAADFNGMLGRGVDRIFFGTGMINCEARLEIGRVGLADLPESVKKMIFAGNFRRLLANRRKPG